MTDTIKNIPPAIDPATAPLEKKTTEVGSVFVSNYPAYSFWSEEAVPEAHRALNRPGERHNPLGLYLHIPFCRKRCKFCYFKVYTGKNSDEIQIYLDALARELETYGKLPAVQQRPLKFVYFGGGTPSFISVKHLKWLVAKAREALPWDGVEEVAFECEPGTLSQSKLEAIKEIGVTRLSLGIEHFNDDVLRENGRAHVSKEIYRIQSWVKEMDFAQLNIDLIAGMVGDTRESWQDTVQRAIDYDPHSVTIYQLELPYNAVYSRHIREGEKIPVADWNTKQAWHSYAIDQLLAAGYEVSSAYTMIKKDSPNKKFVYRDALWRGSDMLATGVASFGHMSGVHFQNAGRWDIYLEGANAGRLPIQRAFATNRREQLIREMILQLKLGRIEPGYFRDKFSVNILSEFAEAFQRLEDAGQLHLREGEITLTRKGLLQVDQLLPQFYEPKYRNARYT